jgi:hypothetical protein
VVPSKAITAVNIGSTILFCGDKDSDNWHMLCDAGWLIHERENMNIQIAQFLESVSREDIFQKKIAAKNISLRLQQYVTDAYSTIAGLCEYAD